MASHRSLDRFYINGRWVAPASESHALPIKDPGTEQQTGTVTLGSQADVDAAVAAARAAFPSYADSSVDARADLLMRICTIYERRLEEMAEAITSEMGAPLQTFSRTLQAPVGLWHFQTALACLKDFEFERRVGSSTIRREPVGVVGMITPWNWPINQIACKVAPALAMGCTIVLKPSEFSPYSAQLLAEILDEAEVPHGVFNMVFGDGPTVGERLASHPDVDMISITGSTAAGVRVSKLAAETVKRVSLELGGKSANIILPDAPLEQAVTHGVLSMMSNSGQTCTAPSRMLVPRDRLAEVETIAATVCAQIIVGNPRDESVTVGPLANEKQFNKVRQWIEIGSRESVRVVAGGPGRPNGLDHGYFVRPTIFSGASNDMSISREEIFGPVLVIIPYDSEDEAIRIANDSDYGLAGYVFGGTLERAASVARQLRTGMVHLNGAFADLAAPFGGYKRSGNGREWGMLGLEEFSEVKAIIGTQTP